MNTPAAGSPLARLARGANRAARGLGAGVGLATLTAGLPWALVHGIGWPLPDHLPTLSEVGAVLTGPLTSTVLLDALACVAWLLWLVFVVDVAACAVDLARGTRRVDLRAGPLRRVAAVLVGALLVAVLGRTATAAPPHDATPVPGRAATAAAVPGPAAATSPDAAHTGPHRSGVSTAPGTERVRAPVDGVHDSLWRVAQRRLGDGNRWPEIWALNAGTTQPGGRVLTDPNLLHPDDTLRIPTTPPPAPPPPARPRDAPSPERDSTPAPPAPSTPTPPAKPTPTTTPTAERAADTTSDQASSGVVAWGSGAVFVSLGLAAAVSALLVLARRRHRARYRPGSGRRDDDPPLAPVVYQLRLAHLATQHPDNHLDTGTDIGTGTDTGTDADADADADRGRAVRVVASGERRLLGVDLAPVMSSPSLVDLAGDLPGPEPAGETGRVALDLARAHGLGLVGPGSYAAARALLLTLLTATPPPSPTLSTPPTPRVLVPAADLARLLGVPLPPGALPTAITVVDDLDTALATLDTPTSFRPTALITSPPDEAGRQSRLQQLLDNHGQHGLTAVLLGQWRPGVTAYVTADGRISATDPGLGEGLRGTRAFTLPDTATRDLLTFLHTTHSDTHGEDSGGANQDRDPHAPVPYAQAASVMAATTAGSADGGRNHLEITATEPESPPSPAEDDQERHRPPEPPPPAGSSAAAVPLELTVFGTPTLHWRADPTAPAAGPRDVSGALSPRLVELLVLLAVHPAGVTRERIVDALWPDAPPRNPASVLRTILSRIRRALDTATHGTVRDPVTADHGRYRLDPAVITVDYWAFADALTARRAATTPEQRTRADADLVAHYRGPLADGLDTEWLTATREALRRDALDAVAALARARVDNDPQSTLDLLETARAFDPHNELLYRDIMRLQHKLGRHDAISRTLDLLRTRLTEIDDAPTGDILDLARRLRAHDTGIPLTPNPPDTQHQE